MITLADALNVPELILPTLRLTWEFLVAFSLSPPVVECLMSRLHLSSLLVFDVHAPAIPVHANNRQRFLINGAPKEPRNL